MPFAALTVWVCAVVYPLIGPVPSSRGPLMITRMSRLAQALLADNDRG